MKNINPKPFFCVIEYDILNCEFLNNTDKILYIYIRNLCNNKIESCFARNCHLTELTGFKEKTIQRALRKLKKYDFIKIEFRGNKRYIKTTSQAFHELQMKKAREFYEEFGEEEFDWLNN